MIAAAVCPHPPALVPELSGGYAPDLDGLRAACDTAIERLYAGKPDVLVIVGGSDADNAGWRYPLSASFQPYGIELAVDVAEDMGNAAMPLSLLVAGWLLRERSVEDPARAAFGTPPGRSAGFYAELGGRVSNLAPRTAMLVMGDGSACRSVRAPGHFDERAEEYDRGVAAALAGGDHQGLAALDADVSAELSVAGRGAWQVLAGGAAAAVKESGRKFVSELLYDEAPYGVGYFVASWAGE